MSEYFTKNMINESVIDDETLNLLKDLPSKYVRVTDDDQEFIIHCKSKNGGIYLLDIEEIDHDK